MKPTMFLSYHGRMRGDNCGGLWIWSAQRWQIGGSQQVLDGCMNRYIRIASGQQNTKPTSMFFQPGLGPGRDINQKIRLGWVHFGNQEKPGLLPTPTWKLNQTMPIQVEKRGVEIPKRIEMCLLLDGRIHEANEYVSMKEEVNVYNYGSAVNNLYEPLQTGEVSSESDSDSENFENLTQGPLVDNMIEQFIDVMTTVTEVLIKHKGVVQILEDFLHTLAPGSEYTITNRALQHFDNVKNVWRNQQFVGVLRTVGGQHYLPLTHAACLVSKWRQAEFIMRMMMSEPSFGDILKYQDQATMMRNGLSILIGYWSNEEMIDKLLSIGGSSLRTLLKGDDILACGEKSGEEEMCADSLTPIKVTPFYSPIKDLRNDSSIDEFTNQLLKIPEAVMFVEEFLISLQANGTAGKRKINVLRYYSWQGCLAKRFWFEPVIILELIKALNQSKDLVKVFRKCSEIAQAIRCVENMTRIQSDPMLDYVFTNDDPVWRMRGIFSILIGYCSESDVLEFFRCIYDSGYDLKEDDDVQFFKYLAYGPGDVEGLKNELAEKYSKDSEEYKVLFDEISKYPEMKKPPNKLHKQGEWMFREKKKAPWEDGYELALMRVVLSNKKVIYYDVGVLI